eukprot:jgi/Chrpa1/21522/Chrysochromulina_OHIO_Genome00025560-RA
MAFAFKELAANDLELTWIGGTALSQLTGAALLSCAEALSLPALGDDAQTRMLLGALVVACPSGAPHKGSWSEIRDEARGLLLLALRRDGRVSANTAQACNALNKAPVLQKYQVFGNRWTRSPAALREEAVERARRELGGSSSTNTGEWLRGLADALDEAPSDRLWWTSPPVLFILLIASLFILLHAVLLLRVLMKVHARDKSVLLLPIYGLSAAGAVGALAIAIQRLSGPGDPSDPPPKPSPKPQQEKLTPSHFSRMQVLTTALWRAASSRFSRMQLAFQPSLTGKGYGKTEMDYSDFERTPSGVLFKDAKKGSGKSP